MHMDLCGALLGLINTDLPEYSLARSVNPGYFRMSFFSEGYIHTHKFISRLMSASDNNKGQIQTSVYRLGAAAERQMSFQVKNKP